jgi:hypothetical protein
MLAAAPYTFSRIDAASGDRVVVALDAAARSAAGRTVFADGQWLRRRLQRPAGQCATAVSRSTRRHGAARSRRPP